MQSHSMIERGVSFFTGAGLGAALMYLFDPESGQHRRESISESTRDTLSAAGAGLSGAVESVSESAHRMKERLGDRLHHMRDHSESMTEPVRDRARQVRDSVSDMRQHLMDRMMPRRMRSSMNMGDTSFTASSFIATAVGTALAGAALMYLFDPKQGRRRRAMLRDKGVGLYHDAAGAVRRGGKYAQYAGDYARGTLHEARRMATDQQTDDRTLEARVRSEMGRVVSAPGQVEVNADHGRVTLSGMVAASERAALVEKVRSVPGVNEVSDQLNQPTESRRM